MNKHLILIPFLLLTFSCSKTESVAFIGEKFQCNNKDVLSNIETELNVQINGEFSSSRFYIKDFYNQLEENAINLTSSKRINHILNESNLILFNIGNYEIIRLINYENETLVFNEEIVSTCLEMFDYYLHQSLEIISEYQKNIIVIPSYNSIIMSNENEIIYQEIINKYNAIILKNCDEFNAYYTDIEYLSRFVVEDNIFNESGLNYLLKKIKEYYELDK